VKKLIEEMELLNVEMHGCDTDIDSRRTKINTLEFQTAKSREGLNNNIVKRNGLLDERKFVSCLFL
jgi:hypothetical protein